MIRNDAKLRFFLSKSVSGSPGDARVLVSLPRKHSEYLIGNMVF